MATAEPAAPIESPPRAWTLSHSGSPDTDPWSALTHGWSRADLDTYRAGNNPLLGMLAAADSPVFDHIASGPDAYLLTPDLKSKLNHIRGLLRDDRSCNFERWVWLKQTSPIYFAYYRAEDELVEQHAAHAGFSLLA